MMTNISIYKFHTEANSYNCQKTQQPAIWLLKIYFSWPLHTRNQPLQIVITQWREKKL